MLCGFEKKKIKDQGFSFQITNLASYFQFPSNGDMFLVEQNTTLPLTLYVPWVPREQTPASDTLLSKEHKIASILQCQLNSIVFLLPLLYTCLTILVINMKMWKISSKRSKNIARGVKHLFLCLCMCICGCWCVCIHLRKTSYIQMLLSLTSFK